MVTYIYIIWPYLTRMAIYAHIYPYMFIHAHIWPCMWNIDTYVHVWTYIVTNCHIWPHGHVHGNLLWSCTVIQGYEFYASQFMDLSVTYMPIYATLVIYVHTIYGHIRPYMIIWPYTLSYMVTYGHMWSHMVICGSVWSHMAIFGHTCIRSIWSYVTIHNYISYA